MTIQIVNQIVAPGQTVLFPFNGTVESYLVGISYWKLKYANSTDHKTQQISLSIASSSSGNSVKATPTAVLFGQGDGLDPSSSTIHMTCIAVLQEDKSDIVLATAPGLSNNGRSSPISTPLSPTIDAAVVTGWNTAYSGSHHVNTFKTGAQTSVTGTNTTIVGAVDMHDSSNTASNPTVDTGLIATSNATLLSALLQNQQTTSPPQSLTFPGGNGLSSVGVMLEQLTVSYAHSAGHDIEEIGGGTTGWTVDGNKVTLNDACAFMSDHSHNHQNDSQSSVSLIVFAVPS